MCGSAAVVCSDTVLQFNMLAVEVEQKQHCRIIRQKNKA